MALQVLTIVFSILRIFFGCTEAAAISIHRDHFMMASLNPLHHCQVELHHFLDVYVQVENFAQQDFDPQLFVHLNLTALVPPDDLLDTPRLHSCLIIHSDEIFRGFFFPFVFTIGGETIERVLISFLSFELDRRDILWIYLLLSVKLIKASFKFIFLLDLIKEAATENWIEKR